MTHTRPDRGQLALLLTAVLVVLSGCAGMGGGGDAASAPQAGGNGGDGAELDASYEGDGGGNGVGSYYTDDGDRVVVRESDVSLRVDNFSRAFHRLRAIAADNDGYVGDRSQDSQGEWDRGTVTLRVPPEQFASARDAVASLGHVEREDVHVKDFTSEYDDREERIRQLEGEERSLERLLNETDDVDEAERVRNDLSQVRSEIRELRSQQQSLQQRESMSTIRVDMHEPESEKPPKNYESAFGFTDAFLEAFYGGLTALKYVIVFFGYVIPVGLALIPLGAFGVGIVAGWRRSVGFVRRLFASSGGGTSAVTAADATGNEEADGETGDDSDSE